MIIYRDQIPRRLTESYRPLYERLKITFPQLLLETTALDIYKATSSDRKAKADQLDKPVIWGGTTIDFQRIQQTGYRDFYFTATIDVEGGKDIVLLDPETGQVMKNHEPARYYISAKIVNGFKYIWEPVPAAYGTIARELYLSQGDDSLLHVDPMDWLVALDPNIPLNGHTGKSYFGQKVFSKGFKEAFKKCDILLNCNCTWFEKQLKPSNLDWTKPTGIPLERHFTSNIDTKRGQELAAHKGSAIQQAIERGEELYRYEPDRIRKTNRVNKKAYEIGSRQLGGFQDPDTGEYVVNGGYIYNEKGQRIAYPNGDPLDAPETEVHKDLYVDPNAKRIDPCTHITRTLISAFKPHDTYGLCTMLGQRMISAIWVNGRAEPGKGLDNAWQIWVSSDGRSIVDRIARSLDSLDKQ